MADEEVKPNEEIAQVAPETVAEVPAEAKQEELPLAASEEKPAEETEIETKTEEQKPDEINADLPLWARRELGQKARKIQEAAEKEAELLRELETVKALAAKFNQKTETPSYSNVPINEVEKRAKELVAQQKYLDECNKTNSIGETKYKTDWKEAVSNLQMLGGFDQDTMNGILASDDPAKTIYELGKNPANYQRIMDLPVPRRIIEIGKIAVQQTSPKKVSEAPPPVNPVGGRAAPAPTTLSDNMDDDKWFQVRRAQRRAKWEAQQPRR